MLAIGMPEITKRFTLVYRRNVSYQNEDVGLRRCIGVELLDRKMVRKDVLEGIAEYLAELPEEYYATISNDFDDSLELFLIAVTRHAVYGRFESIETARAFGFDPKDGDIGPI